MIPETSNPPDKKYNTRAILIRFGIIGLFLYRRFKDTSHFQSRGRIMLLFAIRFFLFFFIFLAGLSWIFSGSFTPILLLIILISSILYGYWASIYFTDNE